MVCTFILPLLSVALVLFSLISHPLADAFEESSQDLESAKTRLEVEVEESRKTNDRENEAREAAETARARIQRELAELREKYDEEVIIRTNLERYEYSSYSCLSSSHTCIRTRKKAEADYEDAKEQLEVESKLRAKLERDVKAQAKGGKDLQTAKAEADKLKARVTSLEKMEADYKRYVPHHLSFSLSLLYLVLC